jgi:hypothetical protein
MFSFLSCDDKEQPSTGQEMQLLAIRVGGYNLLSEDTTQVPSYDKIFLTFHCPVDTAGIMDKITLFQENSLLQYNLQTIDNNQTISLIFDDKLEEGKSFELIITGEINSECGVFNGIKKQFRTSITPMELVSIHVGEKEFAPDISKLTGLGIKPAIQFEFSDEIDETKIKRTVSFVGTGTAVAYRVVKVNGTSFQIHFNNNLQGFNKYNLYISDKLVSENDRSFPGASFDIYTSGDSTYKFPELSDKELLTKVQKYTFKYFWDFGHPVSGLSRERNTSGDLVTIGGSGFGIMSIIVGIKRGFVSRRQGIERIKTLVDFLANKADRFHGVWPHWLSGTSGKVIPFSSNDNGGDLVETAFMIQGLYTVRQYLDKSVQTEKIIIETINQLIDEVEWDWYTQGGQNVLYWHWSPDYEWQMNHQIRGWNEALIIYILAASSSTHPIDKSVYENGWARNGGIKNSNNNQYFGYQLPLRSDMGGPLFFAHYSFLGLNPHNLEDHYANYWEQNTIHTKINRAYCVANPKQYVGYSEKIWGLTASDGNQGYSAHSPNNDRGVITPTAAISSIPYTPDESMEAIRFFYYVLGDKIWGEYGFYDAFNITANWYADSYIAIDQGPIICMIENYRSGMLWELFMSAPEIQDGLDKLGFTY